MSKTIDARKIIDPSADLGAELTGGSGGRSADLEDGSQQALLLEDQAQVAAQVYLYHSLSQSLNDHTQGNLYLFPLYFLPDLSG